MAEGAPKEEEPPRDGAADEPMGLPWACVGGGGRQRRKIKEVPLAMCVHI